jgi:hypothetical protein
MGSVPSNSAVSPQRGLGLSIVSCCLLSVVCCLLSSLRIETIVLSVWFFSGEYLSPEEVLVVQFYLSMLSTIQCSEAARPSADRSVDP